MNEQLVSHLQSFDSDEEYSESLDLVVDDHGVPVASSLMVLDVYLTKLRNSIFRRISWPESFLEGVQKFIWVLPIGIMLGDYISPFMGIALSTAGFIVVMLQPESYIQQKEILGGDGCSGQIKDVMFERCKSRQNELHPASKRQVQNCRKEVSRLLGLVGAPALEWQHPDMAVKETSDDDAPWICSEVIALVVKFLEAHTQFLLTVDEAYRWLQISASLHLGLGPRSQCVERVERASIAREFQTGRRNQSIGGDLIINGVQPDAMEPQRSLCKTVLSLSNVRYNLAKNLIDQSNSILQVWNHVQNQSGDSEGDPGTQNAIDSLDMPDVIDLVWIRNARHHITSILSGTVGTYCNFGTLMNLTSHKELCGLMEASLSNARNAREYLLCNLLLGKRRPGTPIPNPTDPLLLSLLSYREQLDALSGAIWSCEQYADVELASHAHGRQEWWTRIKQLSSTCRDIEEEISHCFFSPNQKEENSDDTARTIGQIMMEASPVDSSNEYQLFHPSDHDGVDNAFANATKNTRPAKLEIYKGRGSKEERLMKDTFKKGDGKGNALSLPPRDTVSERQMIQELQNRITILRPPDEDESDQEIDENRAELEKKAREPSGSSFLGATGPLLSELKKSLPSSMRDGDYVAG